MLPNTKEPTLLHRCSQASTAAESRFRIDRPVLSTRSARIIAIDEGAAAFLADLVKEGWDPDRFLTYVAAEPVVDDEDGPSVDAVLEDQAGQQRHLRTELSDADAVVMLASRGDAAEAASLIGDICLSHPVMTAGIVVAPGADVDAVVHALRPNAMVLVILDDGKDVHEMLTALRV